MWQKFNCHLEFIHVAFKGIILIVLLILGSFLVTDNVQRAGEDGTKHTRLS
jgi:hypothetical protein